MHISPCVVSVMAAAAADFPGFLKPYTAANLKTKPSASVVSEQVLKQGLDAEVYIHKKNTVKCTV